MRVKSASASACRWRRRRPAPRRSRACSNTAATANGPSGDLLRLLSAAALSAPSKSDLQQTDIVHVADRAKRTAIVALIDDMDWILEAPVFLVFCGNNRRLRLLSQWRGTPFPNDHLDQFFNAACDAAIVMATFVQAAEAVGLGCCPISHVRNHAEEVSALLELPQWVFPFAGLCVGYPARGNRITPRLPLDVTLHTDRYDEGDLAQQIERYDARRHALQPYARQRDPKRFGLAPFYGWSTDKARQYAVPERENFGAFVRKRGFGLE
jgi:nitroreductase/FMN reductase [NAD(P)H]